MAGSRTRAHGELEREIVAILRAASRPMAAGEIRDAMSGQPPAHTTVLTALDRLCTKGDVIRHQESPRKLRFAAASSAVEAASDSMVSALAELGDRHAALLRFAGNLDDDDAEFLRAALEPRLRGR